MTPPVNLLWRLSVDGATRLEAMLLPPRCLVCQAPGLPALDLCDACRYALPWLEDGCPRCGEPLPPARAALGCERCRRDPLPMAGVVATFRYAPPIDVLLLRHKFHHGLSAGRLLASLMAERLAGHGADPLSGASAAPVLVPIPLHPARLRARGHDQVAGLARPLCRQLGLRYLPLLRRVIATAPQSGLDAAARQRNLGEAFRCAQPPPPRVILFDDVMTTGATLRAAALALQRGGATRVEAWVVARAVKDA